MQSKEKDKIIKDYVKLARKIGKLPNAKDVQKYVTSERQVGNHFDGFNDLKSQALELYPELEEFVMPAKLSIDDLEMFRLKEDKKVVVKGNKDFITKVNTLEYLSKFADNLYSKQIKPYKPITSKKSINRALVLTLSDLHYGADIKSEETGFQDYGVVEESRRTAEVIRQTIDYKPHYRANTALYVNLLGDLIQHKLHDPQAAAPMAEQITRAIHVLSQGLAQLGENFPEVYVQCATGNHGRDLSRHQQRASSGKWDSIESVIYYALRKILAPYKNIKFNIPKTPFNVYDVLGHKIFSSHGDTVLKPGNPGKSLNISNLENQINKINSSLKDLEEIKVVIVGHTHCASVSNLNTGAIVVTNGCLPPSDDYTVSIGYLENRASQTLFEVTKDYAVGDIRFIRVGYNQDVDKTLDKVIKPYVGFNE